MKNIIKVISFIIILSVTSCSKSFLDVNDDPNNPRDVPVKTLLPNATIGMAFSNGNEIGKASALLMQITAGIAGNSSSYDRWNLGSMDNQWTSELYANVINNLGIIIEKSQDRSLAYSGIAKLEQAYTFSMITDLWGDVPYSEAGKGLNEDGTVKFSNPRFDAQQDIYLGNQSLGIQSLFNLVREGLAEIAANGPARPGIDPGVDDLVYYGDLSKWTRFGNSLLMKFALQVSNKAPDTTRNVINDIISNNKPFINALNGSLDFNVPFTTANPNPYYLQDIGGSITNTQMLSNHFLQLERSLNDSLRLSKFFIKPAATFIGHDNGSPIVAPTAATRSYYGEYVLGATRRGEAPIRLITAFRNFFILAEAALRFGVSGDPNMYFQNGIRASMQSVGLTDAQITAYFTANPTIVNLTGTNEEKHKQIITQKYVASVGNALEAYNDYRRTGYPILSQPLVTDGDDPNVFPQRFPYTNREGASNPNQPNPRPRTTVKVWWQ
ncbi:MAG: SusD/RagB family nutrient-binding outer membrane lipoprotein [Chitinophagaceae bacterium]